MKFSSSIHIRPPQLPAEGSFFFLDKKGTKTRVKRTTEIKKKKIYTRRNQGLRIFVRLGAINL
jgi:hypothetical protein